VLLSHHDRASGALLNYAVRLGPRSSYRFFAVDPRTAKPRLLASWPVAQPAYMHSFVLTERWLVLVEFPFVVNPARLVLAGRPYIENFNWKPGRGTRFHLVDRITGERRDGFEADPCFAFHHANAYDEGSQLVVDLCALDDHSLIEDLYLDRLRGGAPIRRAALKRFRLDLDTHSVTAETLSEANLELPRINYERCNELPYRYVWGVGVGTAAGMTTWSRSIPSTAARGPGRSRAVSRASPSSWRDRKARTRTTASCSRSCSMLRLKPHHWWSSTPAR
jgi:beta,beta-carotene 9',10'-dioxygenase